MATERREQAKEAFLEIVRDGESPTVSRIRERIGGGGTGMIQSVINEMRARQKAFIDLPEAPAVILESMTDLWCAAIEVAKGLVEQECVRLNAALAEESARVAEAHEHAKELDSRLEEKSLALQRQQQEIGELTLALEARTAELDASQRSLAAAGVRLAERTSNLESMTATCAELRADLAQSRDRVAESERQRITEIGHLQDAHRKEISELRERLHAEFKAERDRYELNSQLQSSTIHKLNARVADMESTLLRNDSEAKMLQQALQARDARVAELGNELVAAVASGEVLRESLASLRGELDGKVERIESLLTENATLRAKRRSSAKH